jgi:hypothetical protein
MIPSYMHICIDILHSPKKKSNNYQSAKEKIDKLPESPQEIYKEA